MMMMKITGHPTQEWKIKFHAILSAKLQKIWADLRLCIISLAYVADVTLPSAKQLLLSLLWALNGLNELPEVRLEFTFNLIGKLTIAFLMDQSWRVHKSWYTGGGPEQGFRRCFSDGLEGLYLGCQVHFVFNTS